MMLHFLCQGSSKHTWPHSGSPPVPMWLHPIVPNLQGWVAGLPEELAALLANLPYTMSVSSCACVGQQQQSE